MKPEQIDNFLPEFPRGKYEKFIKKQTSRLRRKEAKKYCKEFDDDKPLPNDKEYKGWTT